MSQTAEYTLHTLRKLFAESDTDGSGLLHREELAGLYKRWQTMLGFEDVSFLDALPTLQGVQI